MSLSRSFSAVLLISLLSTSAYAGAEKATAEDSIHYNDLQKINSQSEVNTSQNVNKDKRLKPRVELNHRYSNDRAITMSEFWVPLAQNEIDGSVLFGDVRIMGDNNSNDEYNAGIGYREVVNSKLLGEGVAGGMVWLDRRHTARGSKFNQITTGLEWLGEQYDVRLNGYVPLNSNKSHTQANPNGSGLGFVGNQILVNTDQSVVEEALPGLDLELGYKLDFMDSVTDSTRVYGGAYHFQGDRAENVTGFRTRIASDITSDIQLGARYQHDDVRGSQTYLEATVRFPFKSKKSFKREGLRSRLDEAPERDIDIVSNEAVIDDGISQAILNVNTGTTQNVVHVDNTAAGGGDGSIETPYNTLAVAEGVAVTNDLIYVHRGDGTTAGQANGITIDDEGQMLVGTGVDLRYDTSRFRTPNGLSVTNGILAYTTTTAPVISNGAGNGVDITAEDVFVSGITVDGATSHGVSAINNMGEVWDSIEINNITTQNNIVDGISINNVGVGNTIGAISLTNNISNLNGRFGFDIGSNGAAELDKISLINNLSNNNTNDGYRITANGVGSNINSVNVINNTADTNLQRGFLIFSQAGGDIDKVIINNNTSNDNTATGFEIFSQTAGSNVNSASLSNNSASNNSTGFYAQVRFDGAIGKIDFNNNTAMNSTFDGYLAYTTGTGSAIDSVSFINNVSNINGRIGFYAVAQTDASIGQANFTKNTAIDSVLDGFRLEANGPISTINSTTFENNISKDNAQNGFYALSSNSGDISTVNFTDNLADNNTQRGFRALALNDGDIGIVNFNTNTSTNNVLSGFRLEVNGAGSSIDSASFEYNTSDDNGQSGFHSFILNGGNLITSDIKGNTSRGNTLNGIIVQTSDVGSTINTTNLSDNIVSGNNGRGLYFVSENSSNGGIANFVNNTSLNNAIDGFLINVVTDAVINEVFLLENTSIGNIFRGININDDSIAGGIVTIDAGNGVLGSIGNNSAYGNTLEDLAVDLNGAELKAENNWWGTAAGLLPAELLLQDASTVDADPFLTVAP